MNILFIIPEEYEGARWGGVTTYSLHTARYLCEHGDTVSILTPGRKYEQYKRHGIHIYKICDDNKYTIFDKIIRKISPTVSTRIRWQRSVLQFVRTHDAFTIIEAPEWGSSTLFLSLHKLSKIVVRLHRSWYQYQKDNALPIALEARILHIFEWFSVLFADAVTSPTVFMKSQYSWLESLFKMINKKIEFIPNGIPMHHAHTVKPSDPKPKRILFIGRLEVAKGCECLIRAIEKVIQAVPTVQVSIIGEDTRMYINNVYCSYKSHLVSYVRNKKMGKNIRFIPRVRNSQLYRYYKTCSVFVISSVGCENSPMSLLEAISYNIPIVGSNAGGIPEIINETQAGLIYSQGDSDDLADKILVLLNDTHLQEDILRNIEKRKYSYDIVRTASLTKMFYLKCSS